MPVARGRNSTSHRQTWLQEVLANQAAAKQRHEDVNQVQIAHGLHRGETNQRRRQQDDAGDGKLEGGKQGRGAGEPRHRRPIRATGIPRHSPENEDRRDDAKPFIPGPAADEVVVTGVERLSPGCRRALEDPEWGDAEGARAGAWRTFAGRARMSAIQRITQYETPRTPMMGCITTLGPGKGRRGRPGGPKPGGSPKGSGPWRWPAGAGTDRKYRARFRRPAA